MGQTRQDVRLTLQIDMDGPVALDMWHCTLPPAMQSRIVAGADACVGRIEVAECVRERWKLRVVVWLASFAFQSMVEG